MNFSLDTGEDVDEQNAPIPDLSPGKRQQVVTEPDAQNDEHIVSIGVELGKERVSLARRGDTAVQVGAGFPVRDDEGRGTFTRRFYYKSRRSIHV